MISTIKLTGSNVNALAERIRNEGLGCLDRMDSMTICRMLLGIASDRFGESSVIDITNGILNSCGDQSNELGIILTNRYKLGMVWKFIVVVKGIKDEDPEKQTVLEVQLSKIPHPENKNAILIGLQYDTMAKELDGTEYSATVSRPLIEYTSDKITIYKVESKMNFVRGLHDETLIRGEQVIVPSTESNDGDEESQSTEETNESIPDAPGTDEGSPEPEEGDGEEVVNESDGDGDESEELDGDETSGEVRTPRVERSKTDFKIICDPLPETQVDWSFVENLVKEIMSDGEWSFEYSVDTDDLSDLAYNSDLNGKLFSALTDRKEFVHWLAENDLGLDSVGFIVDQGFEIRFSPNSAFVDPNTPENKAPIVKWAQFVNPALQPFSMDDHKDIEEIVQREADELMDRVKSTSDENAFAVYLEGILNACEELQTILKREKLSLEVHSYARGVGFTIKIDQALTQDLEETMNSDKSTEPVKTDFVDITDPEYRNGTLLAMFGTTAPSANHVHTFLNEFHNAQKTKSFLETKIDGQGTYPTESDVFYDNIVWAFVKMKDGKFWRIAIANRDFSLDDESWIATHHMPGRWVTIAEVQDGPNHYGFRRRNNW